MFKKIISIENLKKRISKLKTKNKRIVLCHGVFDLLHLGHINHFKEAKNCGDILVVSVTPDKYVKKGPNRPAFHEQHRMEVLSAINTIDFIVLNRFPTAVSIIKELKPNIYCKGQEYKSHQKDISGEIKNEINALKMVGGKIFYTGGVTFSSSNLLNQFSSILSLEQKATMSKIKRKYSFPVIKKIIEDFFSLKVLIIGETIIDQYIFCEALGKSGKEPILVLKDIKTENYLGGAAAISRHLSTFCSKTSLLSMLGEKSEFYKEINTKLPKNVKFDYIKKKNSSTILKKRFLDHISNNKVLGVYKINDEPLNFRDEKLFNKKLKKLLPNFDLVVVSDYGHGLISEASAKIICNNSKYLALNAQINAANIGYHSMRKYKNVDCIIINSSELRYELRNKIDKIEKLMKLLTKKINIKNLIVTKGSGGAILYNKKNNKFDYCPAFATKITDKVGAGDAMMSIISLALRKKVDPSLSLLIGSLAGAQSVETIGNSISISKKMLLKNLQHLMK